MKEGRKVMHAKERSGGPFSSYFRAYGIYIAVKIIYNDIK